MYVIVDQICLHWGGFRDQCWHVRYMESPGYVSIRKMTVIDSLLRAPSVGLH